MSQRTSENKTRKAYPNVIFAAQFILLFFRNFLETKTRTPKVQCNEFYNFLFRPTFVHFHRVPTKKETLYSCSCSWVLSSFIENETKLEIPCAAYIFYSFFKSTALRKEIVFVIRHAVKSEASSNFGSYSFFDIPSYFTKKLHIFFSGDVKFFPLRGCSRFAAAVSFFLAARKSHCCHNIS